MTLLNILAQATPAVADSLASVTKKFSALPDSLSNITPEKLQQSIENFSWNDVVAKLSDVAVTFGLRIIAALVVLLIGRFIIRKVHNLLRAIMVGRDVDRSLTTFLLSLFKITFYFILAIIVISILGIETSSFIAIFASAGIAIGMAFSGTLQNFAGGVLILLLKPYRVGDYIEFGTFKGTVKEIQIFHTIIITYNNEAIIIPNGGLSTGTINNYSREKYRRLEWRVSISYGDDIEVAREAITRILLDDSRILTGNSLTIEENDTAEKSDIDQTVATPPAKLPWYRRIIHRHKRLRQQAAQWREEQRQELQQKMPTIDFTPYVAVETLSDSSVILIVRAWCEYANYWKTLYAVNENIYTQLPQHNIHFPFPQMDVHITK